MGVLDKEQLIESIMRLRRAERVSPALEEISIVRADLERSLGPTVGRAMAARRLGVSQTALDRWIEKGDVPVVLTPSGRREIPLNAFLDLLAEVDEWRPATANPLAAVLRERRSKADALDLKTVLPPRYRQDLDRHGHRRAELRSLAYHRAVAERLNDHLVAEARHRLTRWERAGHIDERYATAWRRVLDQPLPRIKRLVSEGSERGRDLRQNSPFAGVLNEPERKRILALVS